MKIVVYSASSLLKPAFGVLLDEAECQFHEGNEVTFVYCDRPGVCSYNPTGEKILCWHCRNENRKMFKKLSKGIKVVPFSKYHTIEEYKQNFHYSTVEEIKNIKYKGVEIGYSCLSSYLDYVRNPNPNVSHKFRAFFDRLLNEAVNFTDKFEVLIQQEKPSVVIIYNGRSFDINPLRQKCSELGIEFKCMEVITHEGIRYKNVFKNGMPHDPVLIAKKVNEEWQDSFLSEEEKKKIGESFYINRRKGSSLAGTVYTGMQKKEKLPDTFDLSKRNIAVFNSSEDELVSLGSSFTKMNLFTDQFTGIKYILESFKNENSFHFYLRIHPNLNGLNYSYHTDLYELSDIYKNVTIIAPEDNIDSYALMDACEKTIVFSSTMGIEAAYWNKPAIVLGATFYRNLNCCYVPHKKEMIARYISDCLLPKDNYDAIKYGYYAMAEDVKKRFKHVDFDPYIIKVGKKMIVTANYQKVLGSRFLFSLKNTLILNWVKLIRIIPQ